MTFEYNSVKISYQIFGSGEPCLLLHGWGCDGKIFQSFIQKFEDRKFVVPDFPPFGESGENIEDWTVFTYLNMIKALCEHLKIEKCDVIGHSFGGRIAILLGALHPEMTKSIVLVDSAGLKPKRSLKYYLKVFNYKLLKKMGFKLNNAGSSDYKKMPANLRKTFVNIVSQPLDEYCPLISAPTLIVFGKNDKETPIFMAKRLKKQIKTSKLTFLEDAGHYSFLDSPLLFYKTVQEFWGSL